MTTRAFIIILLIVLTASAPAAASPRALREGGQRITPAMWLAAADVPISEDRSPKAGALDFPQDPSITHFVNSWRNPRSGGRRHKGADLMAPKHSPVFAIADGVVTEIDWGRRSGYQLWIEHAGGVRSVYLHLNNDNPGTDDGDADLSLVYAPGIEEGALVRRGQLVGWVGDSGNAEGGGAHTHFELHINGREVNPYPYLKQAWDEWELRERATALEAEMAGTLRDRR